MEDLFELRSLEERSLKKARSQTLKIRIRRLVIEAATVFDKNIMLFIIFFNFFSFLYDSPTKTAIIICSIRTTASIMIYNIYFSTSAISRLERIARNITEITESLA